MLWSENQFNQAVGLAWSELVKTKPANYEAKLKEVFKRYCGLERWSQEYNSRLWDYEFKINCAYGYDFYQKANKTALNILMLGPETIRQRSSILSNFGISSVVPYGATVKNQDKAEKINGILVKNHEHASTTEGAVLSEANWWPFFNDAWVLGGVHNLATFYLHIPGDKFQLRDNVLWDDDAGRARVLGRELIALAAFGYRRITTSSTEGKSNKLLEGLSFVFAPADRELTQSATFEKLCSEVEKFNSANEIQELLSNNLAIEHSKYDYSIMGSNSFTAKDIVPAYFESAIESFHDRVEIAPGAGLSICPGGIRNYLKIQVSNASIRIIRTGVTTEYLDTWSGILYLHKELFSQSSGVVSPR